MFKSAIIKILIKSKNGNYNALYFIFALAGLFSIIVAYSARGASELNPLNSTYVYLPVYYSFFLPIFIISLFYDTISSKVADNSLKKILSEPIDIKTMRYHTLYLIISFSLLLSLMLVIPGAILSYFISKDANLDYFLRYIFVILPTFLYTLFFTSLTFLVSASTSKPSYSLMVNVFLFIFFFFLWTTLINSLNVLIVEPIYGTNSYANMLFSNYGNYFNPTAEYGNSIVPLGNPSMNGFNFLNGWTFAENGEPLTSLLSSLKLSLFFMIPMFFYTLIIILGVVWRVSNLKRFY